MGCREEQTAGVMWGQHFVKELYDSLQPSSSIGYVTKQAGRQWRTGEVFGVYFKTAFVR